MRKWMFARRRHYVGTRALAYGLTLLVVASLSFMAGWHAGAAYGGFRQTAQFIIAAPSALSFK